MTENLQVAISADVLTGVHEAIRSGEFGSPSGVVEQALRVWHADRMAQSFTKEDDEYMGRMWDEAMADTRPPVDPEEVFARLRERYRTPEDQA